jgi:predicted TIM-barrel fold metal-dependent hydrolase
LWRLDEEYRNLAGEVAENVRMKPSAYFRRQCFATVEPSEPNLAEVIRYVGEGSLLFGTDFPHLDHEAGIVAQAVAMEEHLTETSLRKILWENSARLYGMAV